MCWFWLRNVSWWRLPSLIEPFLRSCWPQDVPSSRSPCWSCSRPAAPRIIARPSFQIRSESGLPPSRSLGDSSFPFSKEDIVEEYYEDYEDGKEEEVIIEDGMLGGAGVREEGRRGVVGGGGSGAKRVGGG